MILHDREVLSNIAQNENHNKIEYADTWNPISYWIISLILQSVIRKLEDQWHDSEQIQVENLQQQNAQLMCNNN